MRFEDVEKRVRKTAAAHSSREMLKYWLSVITGAGLLLLAVGTSLFPNLANTLLGVEPSFSASVLVRRWAVCIGALGLLVIRVRNADEETRVIAFDVVSIAIVLLGIVNLYSYRGVRESDRRRMFGAGVRELAAGLILYYLNRAL